MIVGELKRSHEDRGFLRTCVFPVYLVQEFSSQMDGDVIAYIGDCDSFHLNILHERIMWLKEHHIKHNLRYTTNRVEDEEMIYPICYRLHIEFTCKEKANLYMDRWKNG